MAFADQANACVSTSTTPLDPHERLGPAGATPGVGNLLHGRPGTPVWWRVPTRSRGCVRARRPARRGQAGAQKPPLHVHWRIAGDRTACSWFSIRIIHEASLRVESTYNTEVRSRRGQLSLSPPLPSSSRLYDVFYFLVAWAKIRIRAGGNNW